MLEIRFAYYGIDSSELFFFCLRVINRIERRGDTNGDTSVALLRTVTEGKSSEKWDGVIGNVGICPPPVFLLYALYIYNNPFFGF